MNHQSAVDETHDTIRGLAHDARTLMAATSEATGDQVKETRERIASALERGKAFCQDVQEKAVHEANAISSTAQQHPYKAMGLALALGAFLGVLMAPRHRYHPAIMASN